MMMIVTMLKILIMMMMLKSDNDNVNIPSYYTVRTQRTHRTHLRVSGNRHRPYWHPLHIGAIHWPQEDIVLWHTYNDDDDEEE